MDNHRVTDEELHKLLNGTAPRSDATVRERAQNVFDDNAYNIAQTIVDIAKDGAINPNVRLRAATYAMDRVLGPTSAVGTRNDVDDLLMQAVRDFTKAE